MDVTKIQATGKRNIEGLVCYQIPDENFKSLQAYKGDEEVQGFKLEIENWKTSFQ